MIKRTLRRIAVTRKSVAVETRARNYYLSHRGTCTLNNKKYGNSKQMNKAAARELPY